MKLKATDQIHISAVSSDTLKPGTEFDVSDAMGEELLNKRPDAVAFVSASEQEPPEQEKDAVQTAHPTKDAGSAPENKAVPAAPVNKAKAGAPAAKAKPKG
ncbi:hypothetical protein HRJ34_00150 [Rhizorhabdus wittichii]|uniref:Uncharacterized protein n=1 Tax=Rhizorhabdus wittichii TaxID=160791 RepID=A0A975HE23_9SPHN|nr:hypothetical protein [Rhizorhabdus wittichii]QTH21990.1 hypothetical protein HRJ34_00150 [Rhizorhabdus wittichii]